jgi:hypothetical protein
MGACIIVFGSFGSMGSGGAFPPIGKNKKEPRLDAAGPRFSWSGAGSTVHRNADDRAGNIGTRLPRRGSLMGGGSVVKG